jgi:glycosyltransferase involved in cell wall biosynthesis
MKDLTLIIPAYNEEESIPVFLPVVIEFCQENETHVIIVNDGSVDSTKAYLDENYNNNEFITVIHHKVNKGYGESIKSGISAAKTEFIVTLDADGQHVLEDIIILYKDRILHDADMVVGSRKNHNSASLYKGFGKFIIRFITSLLVKTSVYDLNSGMKLMSTGLAQKYNKLCPGNMAYSNIIVLSFISQKHKVIETNITINNRIGGVSKINTRTAIDTVAEIFNVIMFFNPLKIFGSISFILIVLGVIWEIPIAIQGKGISVGSMMVIVIGMVFFVLGLLAEQISLIRKALL